MAKRHEIGEALGASVRWPPELRNGGALDVSMGWLYLQVGEHVLTRYRSDNGQQGEEIQIPVYDLAEWLALNWWPLLYEPKKADHAEQDPDFRARHWLGYARNGFALPDAWIIPMGGKIEVVSRECYLRSARLRFTDAVHAAMSPALVYEPLTALLNDIMGRLEAVGISDTIFQEAWRQILETPLEAQEFCRLMGSLGLSPYEEHPEIEALLDRLTDDLPSTLVRDLCEALDAGALLKTGEAAAPVWDALVRAPKFDISKLGTCPVDATTDRAAQWGLEAAWQARKAVGVNRSDPTGGDAFFGALGLDADAGDLPLARDVKLPYGELDGGAQRTENAAQIALAQAFDTPRRRFAGARGIFLAWSGHHASPRLLTDGRTRDQQASRAFAAEILAPISYIRSKAYNRDTLTPYQVGQLAQELGVSPMVIENQARSHRIFVPVNN